MNEQMTHWMWLSDMPGANTISTEPAIKAEFVREFVLEEVSDSGRHTIRISADSKYKLYVNDHFVCYGPARGDSQVWYYDEPDLAPFLQVGANTIRIEVLYYQPYGTNLNFGIAHGRLPALYFDASNSGIPELTAEAGGEEVCDADGRLLKWRGRIVEGFHIVREAEGFAPLMIMEDVEGESRPDLAQPDATSARPESSDPAAWQAPILYAASQISNEVSPGNLYPRPIPFMYLKEKVLFNEEHEPIRIKAHETRKFVLDAGEEETGFLKVLLSAPANLKILYSESYYQGVGNSYKTDRADRVNGHLEGFVDTCRGVSSYEPFWYRTFRFLEFTITALDQDVQVEKISFQETGYPLEVRHSYQGGDPVKQKIWDICLRTLRRCMQETYIDCPYYEQLQYVMDTRSQILYSYEVSGDERLAREAIRSFARSQRGDGLLNAAYPSTASNVIPGFSLYYILMVADHLEYFGDLDFIRTFLGTIDRILEFFDRNLNEQGLVGKVGGLNNPVDHFWSFIDWTKEWDKTTGVPSAILTGPITMESLLYILGLEAAATITDGVGRHDTAREYRARAELVRQAIRTNCVNEDQMVVDGPASDAISQHCQVFAALCDILPAEQLRTNLEETLLHPEQYAQCSVAMMFYLFRALEKTGLYAQYADQKLAIYRWMIDMNLTTCVEDDVRQRSDCHGWGALPLYEFLKH